MSPDARGDAFADQKTGHLARREVHVKARFPTRQVYANTDGAELRVITCGGCWYASVGRIPLAPPR